MLIQFPLFDRQTDRQSDRQQADRQVVVVVVATILSVCLLVQKKWRASETGRVSISCERTLSCPSAKLWEGGLKEKVHKCANRFFKASKV